MSQRHAAQDEPAFLQLAFPIFPEQRIIITVKAKQDLILAQRGSLPLMMCFYNLIIMSLFDDAFLIDHEMAVAQKPAQLLHIGIRRSLI